MGEKAFFPIDEDGKELINTNSTEKHEELPPLEFTEEGFIKVTPEELAKLKESIEPTPNDPWRGVPEEKLDDDEPLAA